jgi:hypothetical protein
LKFVGAGVRRRAREFQSDKIEGGQKERRMEIPGKVSVYCPLINAKGTAATLVTISEHGYYQVEVEIKGRSHVMFLPVAHTALYFAEPEPMPETEFEIER